MYGSGGGDTYTPKRPIEYSLVLRLSAISPWRRILDLQQGQGKKGLASLWASKRKKNRGSTGNAIRLWIFGDVCASYGDHQKRGGASERPLAFRGGALFDAVSYRYILLVCAGSDGAGRVNPFAFAPKSYGAWIWGSPLEGCLLQPLFGRTSLKSTLAGRAARALASCLRSSGTCIHAGLCWATTSLSRISRGVVHACLHVRRKLPLSLILDGGPCVRVCQSGWLGCP